MSAGLDGKTFEGEISFRYLIHQWRRRFHQSYNQALETPIDVILTDMEYIQIEEDVRRARQ